MTEGEPEKGRQEVGNGFEDADAEAQAHAKAIRKERKQMEAALLKKKREMSKCVLDSSWTFTIPAVLISIPLSIRFKTYAPLVLSIVSASGFDYYRGMCQCDDLNETIKEMKLAIAIHERENPTLPPHWK